MPAPIKTRINSALTKKMRGHRVADREGSARRRAGQGRRPKEAPRRAREDAGGCDGTRTWSEAHRRIVRKTSLEIVETLDADARRALAAPIFDAYVDLTFAFEAVALKTGAGGRVCARGAPRCLLPIGSARGARSRTIARGTARRGTGTRTRPRVGRPTRRRGPAPPGGAPIAQAVGRAAN